MAKIGLDGKGFKAGVDKVKRQAGNLKADLGKKFSKISAMQVAGAVTGYARRQVEEIFEYTKEVKRLAATFSLSTEQIQKYKAAAEAGGIQLTQLMDGIKDLGKNTAEALMGVQSKVSAFETLGINVDEIRGKNIDEVFMRVAQAVKDIGPILTADQIKAIEDLGGSNLFLSLPVLRSDLEKIFKQLEDLGGIIEEETLDKITMASKRWKSFKTAQRGFWASVTNLAMGAFMTIANIVTSFPDILTSRIDNFKDSLKQALEEGTSLAGAGEAIAGLLGGDLGKLAAQQGREMGVLKDLSLARRSTWRHNRHSHRPIIRGLANRETKVTSKW